MAETIFVHKQNRKYIKLVIIVAFDNIFHIFRHFTYKNKCLMFQW